MDLDLIEKLFALLDKSTAEELEVTENGVTIRMSKRASAPVRNEAGSAASTASVRAGLSPAAAAPGLAEVRAGMTGTFYRSAAPDQPPFVEIGAQVKDGERLALLEAMKTFNPVESECDGTIAEILVADGALVEAGALLFRIARA